jgi:hypothetical protein
MSGKTLDELAELARTDLYKGRPGAAVEWMIHHAKARGSLALADRALATIEWRERDVRTRTMGAYLSNDERIAIEASGPTGLETRNAEDLYAEATERVVLTEHVLCVLTSRFGRPAKVKTEPRQTATNQPPRFGTVRGGR